MKTYKNFLLSSALWLIFSVLSPNLLAQCESTPGFFANDTLTFYNELGLGELSFSVATTGAYVAEGDIMIYNMYLYDPNSPVAAAQQFPGLWVASSNDGNFTYLNNLADCIAKNYNIFAVVGPDNGQASPISGDPCTITSSNYLKVGVVPTESFSVEHFLVVNCDNGSPDASVKIYVRPNCAGVAGLLGYTYVDNLNDPTNEVYLEVDAYGNAEITFDNIENAGQYSYSYTFTDLSTGEVHTVEAMNQPFDCPLEASVYIDNPNPEYICAIGATVNIYAHAYQNGQNPPTQPAYVWSPNIYLQTILEPNAIVVSPTETTTYTVTVYFPDGGTAQESITVEYVDDYPELYVDLVDVNLCDQSAELALTWSLLPLDYFYWVDANTGTHFGTNQYTVSIENTYGTYYVEGITFGGGCFAISNQVTVDLESSPTIYINGNVPITIIEGECTYLQTNIFPTLDDFTYSWSGGDGAESLSENGGLVCPDVTTTYAITVTDNFTSCTYTQDYTVTVEPYVPQEVVINTFNSAICGDTEAHIYASDNYVSYQWWMSEENQPFSEDTYTLLEGENDAHIYPNQAGFYVVAATDAAGNVEYSSPKQIYFIETPGFSINAPDTIFVCGGNYPSVSFNISYPSGATYWSFFDVNTPEGIIIECNITGFTVNSLGMYVAEMVYTVQEAPSGSVCSVSDTLWVLEDCGLEIFPGDTNNDGVANNKDLLNIGVAYGKSGSPRNETSIAWEAAICADWEDSFAAGLNYNFADCNGDGTINAQDTLAIIANYQAVHNKTDESNADAPPLYLQLPSVLFSGETLDAPIIMGNSFSPVNDVYGVAFTINYPADFLIPNSETVLYDPCWLSLEENDLLTLTVVRADEGKIDIAITRIDGNPISGYGTIARLVGILDDIEGKDEMTNKNIEVFISDVYAITHEEQPIELDAQSSSSELVLGIEDDYTLNYEISLYPNPASDKLQLSAMEGIYVVEIVDAKGLLRSATKLRGTTVSIDIEDLEAGIYFVALHSSQGIIYKRFVKM